MPLLVLDRNEQDAMIRERQRTGADQYDEVWDGVYVMSPLANNEHQILIGRFFRLISDALDPEVGLILPGANVSDRDDGWIDNFRVPDVVVVLPNSVARDCDTHWCGGPDFLIEVVSKYDRSREKLDFYAKIGVRELMIVDRHPWSLELFRLDGGRLVPVGRTAPGDAAGVTSVVLPITFRLGADPARPTLEVQNIATGQTWSR